MPVTYEATIERIEEIGPQTRSFLLRLPVREQLQFKPGQFLSFALPVGGETLTRPYTLASSPEEELLEICLNRVANGPGSGFLFDRSPGDPLSFTGPWGTFLLDQRPDAECVFISQGPGVAALRPMLRRAWETPGRQPLRLYQAAETRAHLLYAAEFETAARSRSDFTYDPFVDAGLIDHIVARYIEADADRSRRFFLCAVGDIVFQLRDRLRQAGYERRAVKYERW